MKKKHLTIPFIVLALFVAFGIRNRVTAAPARQGTNLLNNASFEQPFVNGAADGWSTWYMETEKTDSECLSGYHFKPKWNMETNGEFVHNAIASQYIGNNWDTWGGGVSQTVDVTPGTTYRFSFFAKGRTTSEQSPAPSEAGINMNIRAGIDPNGGGQWYDGDVVWGSAASPHDNWQQFSVETTATGDKMTVFTSADLGVPGVNQCREFLDAWFDNAELVAVGAAPPPTAPPAPAATAVPVNTPLPQPTSTTEVSPTEEPQPTEESESVAEAPPEQSTAGATICVNAFHDVNANGLQDTNEGFMADVTFTVASQNAIVGNVISDGSENPKCFYNLEAGRYQVAQQVPANLQMTSAANVAVEASVDNTVGVGFGSRVRGAPVTEALPAEGSTESEAEMSSISGSMICVNAFHDENANGVIDPNEGYMAGVTLAIASGSDQVGQILSTGSDIPTCFNGLDPGPYEASQQVSDRLEMTTAESVMLTVTDGQAMQVEFGSRLDMGDTESAPSGDGDSSVQTEEGADESGLDLLTLGGLAAVVLGVILLGVVIFFLLRR
jgi:hypothetical protein